MKKGTILDILLDKKSLASIDKDSINQFLDVAERNRTLCRVITSGRESSSELFEDKIKICEKKFQRTLRLIKEVQRALDSADVQYSIFKTIDDFPDVGDDIDILINEKNLPEAKRAIMSLNPCSRSKGLYGLEYSKKEHFNFRNKDKSIEVELYPKFTSQGETYIPEEEIINRSIHETFDGIRIKIPSSEDRFLITVTHSMYRHGGLIRIIDVFNTIEFLKREHLDWEFVVLEAKKAGILMGLLLFIDIIDKVSTKYNTRITVPNFLKITKIPFKFNSDDIPFRIPTHLLSLIFTSKFMHDLLKLRWYSAVKVFQTGLIHLVGRFLIFFGTVTGKTSILEKLGLELYGEYSK